MMSTDSTDTRLRDELLSDPAVQESLMRAGKKALGDPAVQEQIVRAAEAKGPQAAEYATSRLAAWASDPEVQSWAKQRAVEAASGAVVMAAGGPARLVGLIEQGPLGVRRLAFGVGGMSAIRSAWEVVMVWHLIFDPVKYLIYCHQLLFGVAILVLEADPEHLASWPRMNGYQDFLIENARLLTKSWGRGSFYILMACLWLAEARGHVLTSVVTYAIGMALLLVGALHWGMAFGIMPHQFTKKLRGAARVPTLVADKAREIAERVSVQQQQQPPPQTGAGLNVHADAIAAGDGIELQQHQGSGGQV